MGVPKFFIAAFIAAFILFYFTCAAGLIGQTKYYFIFCPNDNSDCDRSTRSA